ncbi:Nif3-like dinuclear metal center hexameric protein [Schlesneria sp. T3-172]|uniref:Nif3-like dinuclear metal center hexameric protein n=1 Tax=Schlesneria sphaerica TaxID=3373610 RepID=UPI0037C58BBC
MTTVHDVCKVLKQIAPLSLAEEWDNVGLLLGDESQPVSRAITCLTLTHDVADEAVSAGAQLVVTHHPIMFKPVKQITMARPEGRLLLTLLQNGIAVYSPHTAWDNATTGINQQLAELLELTQIAPLRPRTGPEQVKVVTFVPPSDVEPVRQALWNAGAGVIGNYQQCSFNLQGTGTFFGLDSTNPAIGKSGQLEQVEETRVEVVCRANELDRVLAALRKAHPYEEPAVDVFPLKPVPDGTGAGRYGTFPEPVTLGQLTRLLAQRLKQPEIQFVGDPGMQITRLGIACGAAGEFLRDAHRVGCQAFLTGEARFHSCLEARDLGVGMILPGHYATERFSMEALAKRLKDHFPEMKVDPSQVECDPIRTSLHVASEVGE